jgi:hypothetical protein
MRSLQVFRANASVSAAAIAVPSSRQITPNGFDKAAEHMTTEQQAMNKRSGNNLTLMPAS